jgi:hypothetical protein
MVFAPGGGAVAPVVHFSVGKGFSGGVDTVGVKAIDERLCSRFAANS